MKNFIEYGQIGVSALYTNRVTPQPIDLGVNWDFSEALSIATGAGTATYYLYGTPVPQQEIWVVENVALYKSGGYGLMSVGYGCEILSLYSGAIGWYTSVCEFTLEYPQFLTAVCASSGAGTFYLRYRARVIYTGT